MSSAIFEPAPGGIEWSPPADETPVEAPARPRVLAEDRPGLLVRLRLWVLLGITLLGGFFRFAWLDKPPLWGDEGYTYSRVCGEFRDLLDILQFDGFPPLHYESYWALMHKTQTFSKLTPKQMRIIPAAAGTLMIPAMYFLAAQITRKRTALLVALFTSCSAFMMVYSHDAKMYMQCWLFIALNMGCFLWFLRDGSRLAWLAWVASGLAAAGFHVTGIPALALQPIILLTQRKAHWKQSILVALGLLVIAAGPLGWKMGFWKWTERVDEAGFGAASGVGWNEEYNAGRTGPDLALSGVSTHLYSWEWPRLKTQREKPGIDPDLMHGLMSAGTILLLLFALGAMPWTRKLRNVRTDDPPGQTWWRQALWLGLWIVTLGYGFYCYSMREFASPATWIVIIGDQFAGQWLVIAIEVAVLAAISHFWQALPRYLASGLIVLGLGALFVLFLNVGLTHENFKTQWKTAYWTAFTRWMDLASEPLVLAGLIAALPVIFWHYSAGTFPRRLARALQMALVVGAIFGSCYGVYRIFLFKVDLAAEKEAADSRGTPSFEVWVTRSLKDHGVPTHDVAVRKVAAETISGVPRAELDQRAEAYMRKKEHRWSQLVADKKAANPNLKEDEINRLAAGHLAGEQLVWSAYVSSWMPRYVGTCWPAIAIAACALLVRLPTRPLRYLAVAFFLALNVGQAGARMFLGNEPPMDKIVADIATAQDELHGKPTHTTTRTYLEQVSLQAIGHPGMLNVFGQEGKYYLAQISDQSVTPKQFRHESGPGNSWEIWRIKVAENFAPAGIAAELRNSPQIDRVIIWERIADKSTRSYTDMIAAALGPQWRPEHEDFYAGRMHWFWQDLYKLRRTVYVRQSTPAQVGR